MKRIFFILFLLLLLGGCTENQKSIDLSGKWKIIQHSTAPPAAVDFNDSDCKEIDLPGTWIDYLSPQKEFSATIWLRKKIVIDEDLREDNLFLIMGRVGIIDETWFNGSRIGGHGKIPENDINLAYHFSWQNPRCYSIPSSLVKYGKENIVAIKVYSHVLNGIGEFISITGTDNNFLPLFYKTHRSLLANIISIAFNILFFIGLVILFITQRKKREYLYFAFIAFLTLVCTVFTLDLPFLIHGVTRLQIILFFYLLTNYCVLIGVAKFLEFNNRPFQFSAGLVLLVAEFFVLSAGNTHLLIFRGGVVALVTINLFILAAAALFIRAVILDPRQYWYFLFIAIPIPVSVLRNSWYMVNLDFNNLPALIFMHVPIVFALFSMYYIYEFERTQKEKDTLYAALLRKANRTQRILKSIRKENAKPDPRDVIYDVIEYLNENYRDRYSRKELAKKFGLNEDYMGQIFKKAAGTTISNYINNRRIEAVKELLVETDSKIIDIAYHVGFENLTHFHRQFKAHTGLTPSQYRDETGNSDQT